MGRPGVAGSGRDHFGLTGPSQNFDPRVVAIRADLADIAVAGHHFAPHYSAPMMRSGTQPSVAVRAEAKTNSTQTSELLFGEGFALLDVTGGWAWGYSLADHYVGYLPAEALGAPIAPTHVVAVNVAEVFATADAASGAISHLPRGAQLMGEVQRDWLMTSCGYLALADLTEAGAHAADAATVAEALIGAPYLWGGRTANGIDCSGLVQLAWAAGGVALPRDSDLQLDALADHADVAADSLQRGDLVFFPGHVGIMADGQTIVHASQHWSEVRAEPLTDVVARTIAKGKEPPVTGLKRLR